MPSVKIKDKKQYRNNNVTTIDNEHSIFVQKFANDQEDLPKIKEKLKKKKLLLEKMEEIPAEKLTKKRLTKKTNLKLSIEKVKKQIKKISSYTNELEYIEKTKNILSSYYGNISTSNLSSPIKGDEANSGMTLKRKEKTTLEKLQENRLKNKPKKPTVRKTKIKKNNSQNITSFFKGGEKNNKIVKDKALLKDQYMELMFPHYKSKVAKVTKAKKCEKCKCEMRIMYIEGNFVCAKCGLVDKSVIITDGQNYKDQVKDTSGCPYDRKNHFNERLAQVQAKETTEITPAEYNKIKNEIKKQRISLSELYYKSLRKILKSLGYGYDKYYEHIPYILCKLNRRKPLSLSRQEEDILRFMFVLIQDPFKRHCPKTRFNFLNYWYVLYKFCELLDWTHCFPYFPSLKTSNKLREHDEIWEKICEDLEWVFYKST